MANELKKWSVEEDIASEYQEYNSKNTFNINFVEPSLFKALGDLNGKNILDLACGSGHRTRILKQRKANIVVGVDINEPFIAEAKKLDEKNGLGIQYFVGDVGSFTYKDNFKFDLVMSAWFLGYATSEKDLRQFGMTAYKHLKPGGRFVSVTTTLDDDTIKNKGGYNPIILNTLELDQGGDWVDGCLVKTTLFSDVDCPSVIFVDHYWKFETMRKAFIDVGFINVVKSSIHPSVKNNIIISAEKPR